jgi:hypothetical protein
MGIPFCRHWVKSPTSITLMAPGAVKRKFCFLEPSICLAITDYPFHDSDCFPRREPMNPCRSGFVCPSSLSAKPTLIHIRSPKPILPAKRRPSIKKEVQRISGRQLSNPVKMNAHGRDG